MKSFKDFMAYEDLDFIDEALLPHIAIDMYNHNAWTKSHIVLEKYGIYEGLREIADIIYKDVLREYKKPANIRGFGISYTNDAFKGLPNVFFKNLTVNIDTTSNDGAAYFDGQSSLTPDFLINNVYIEIYVHDIHDVIDNLYHELTHAYHHWKLMLKSDDGLAEMVDKDFYSKLVPDPTGNNVGEFVKSVLYMTLGSERNSFVAQLEGELRNKMKNKSLRVSSPLEALEIIKDTKIYKSYKFKFSQVMAYKEGGIPDAVAEMVAYEYNKISKTNLSVGKVFKKLESLLAKSLKKLESQIGKLCMDIFDTPSSTIPSNTWLSHGSKLVVLAMMFLFSLSAMAQNIFTTDNVDALLNRPGITKEYVFRGEGNVFYKDKIDDEWDFLAKQQVMMIINDTIGYFDMIIIGDNAVVYEYGYKGIEWTPDGPMCLVSRDILGLNNAALCIDNQGEKCTIYVIIRDKRIGDWFMYVLECDPSLPF